MPRQIPPILRTIRRGKHGAESIKRGQPKLWNAKRRIKYSRGLPENEFKQLEPEWEKHVSRDVRRFIEAREDDLDDPLRPEHKKAILRAPHLYFSKSHNVPTSLRKQIWFPNFAVTFERTPHLSPYYASFHVPLWFNKLDLKSYLKELYSVDIIHVRSWVMPSHKDRHTPINPRGRGTAYRKKSKKKMTVQLVEPFVWPDEIKDLKEWDQTERYRQAAASVDVNRRDSQWQKTNPNQEHRRVIAKQAQELLQGKRTWKPTWTQIPQQRRLLEGEMTRVPGQRQKILGKVDVVPVEVLEDSGVKGEGEFHLPMR